MIDWTLEDIIALRETSEVEIKKASGKDGKGSLPKSFWETYSAFANTDGGDIFLGLEENEDKSVSVIGLPDTRRILQELFDLANNRQKISANLLSNESIEEITLYGKTVLRVHVPKAHRRVRPVYVGDNPMKGTYLRRNEGDFVADDARIKRMLAEQGEDAVDGRILKGFGVEDLDQETLNAYRNVFAARSPDHPFLNKPLLEFLYSIGAWRKDRETGFEGITLAGLLMFGKLRPILEEVPHYILDYQERPEAKTENRWIDRITTDGSWSGNIYDFYRKTYQKLIGDLKVPFRLEGAVRIDQTPIHEALREALVNALIHADYSGRVSVLVVKRPDMFGFRNPGLMRVPIEHARQGGDSDCRNRNLQKMFQFVGAGEQAGSGIPKIYQNWQQQHWRAPKISEKREPAQTLFELHMESLLPTAIVEKLDKQFGAGFRALPEIERIALVVAESEGMVDHKRLKDISTLHPSDISKALNNLVKSRFLKTGGAGRGTYYYLSGSELDGLLSDSEGLLGSSEGLLGSSEGLSTGSEGFEEDENLFAC
jgi:ATP-dependent DNA helicase RecG